MSSDKREIRLKTSDDFILRTIAGESILVPVGGENAINGMITINETFCYLWKQFQKPNTFDQVLKSAADTYGVSAESIAEDVYAFVTECLEHGFLKEE